MNSPKLFQAWLCQRVAPKSHSITLTYKVPLNGLTLMCCPHYCSSYWEHVHDGCTSLVLKNACHGIVSSAVKASLLPGPSKYHNGLTDLFS